MKASIQTKLLTMCILLVLVTAVGISATYYVLTRRDKRRESRQRIQIGFDIVLDGLANRLNTYTTKLEEFLEEDYTLRGVVQLYNQDNAQIGLLSFIGAQFPRVTGELRRLSRVISANRLTLYGMNKRLLAAYHQVDEKESVGMYVITQTGNDTYIALDDSSEITSMMYGAESLPDVSLPSGIAAYYEDDIPDTISGELFRNGQQLGFRITAPFYHLDKKAGVLVGEVLYASQDMAEQYASLSKTAVNFFAGNQWSIGTFSVQTDLKSNVLDQLVDCEEIRTKSRGIEVSAITFEDQGYYQGRCALRNAQDTIGAISVSLSQDIERQEIRKILTAVLTISGIVIGFAFVLSLIFSRKTIHSIHNIVSVIVAAAGGDLRKTAMAMTQDEIGMLATKLNQMIAQLRTISTQVQGAAHAVNTTADTILEQMVDLIGHMEQQSTSVDNTTVSVEKITQFIDAVARNTTDLLAAADQILSSIRETRASIEEVTTSTGSLTTNLHLISSSVEQVTRTVGQISENAGSLEEIARQTATEVHHINHVLGDVSQNADQTQQLARETMEAATRGQSSVEASIQGMTALKTVVADTAQIIQEVSSWGEQVSSILDIVDEITEQTSLLSLNASIISAQAGVHGRGFAVVADEIKELATRTKASTKEIGTLVHALQEKTEEGVNNTAEGLKKADQGMHLANAVQEALATILERATRSSTRAADTAQVIQQAADSSQVIRASMSQVIEMVSQIRTAIQDQEQDMGQVVVAVENISGMAGQVNRSSIEQTKTAEQIARSMEEVTDKFSNISEQTEELKQNSRQIVSAMHTIESTTDQILQNASDISGDTVKNLVQQSDVLQQIVNVFKVSS